VAQAETSIATMSPDCLAISGYKYDLAAMPALAGDERGRAHIQNLSNNILGVARKKVEDKITLFLDSLGEG
jgi:hypothetical protein